MVDGPSVSRDAVLRRQNAKSGVIRVRHFSDSEMGQIWKVPLVSSIGEKSTTQWAEEDRRTEK